jgi:hypothetical protein
MSIDPLFRRKYDATSYNCAHFAIEAWQVLTGQDISVEFASFLLPPDQRTVEIEYRRVFRPTKPGKTPCLVLMRNPEIAPHAGVYYDRRILHITKDRVEFQPPAVACLGFKDVRCYKCLL